MQTGVPWYTTSKLTGCGTSVCVDGMMGMRRFAKTAWAFALCFVAALACAQDTAYRLLPEDVIRVMVYNEAQVNALLPIGKDGNVSVPFIGTVRAEGKTTVELETEFAAAYMQRLKLRDPKVSVTIERYRTVRASVGGFVGNPGNYEMRPGDTVLTLLNRGGGPVPDRADLRRAVMRRATSKELIPIDLYSMLILGDTSQNYEVMDGDELTIPEETRNRILVLGTIAQPGTYPFKEPMKLIDAISLARGEVPNKSKLSEVMVVRELPGQPGKYLRIQANLVNFVRKGDATQNISLLPGDLVYVPSTKTPDLRLITDVASTLFYLDRFFRENTFGIGFR